MKYPKLAIMSQLTPRMSGRLILFLLCITLSPALAHPQDISCFDNTSAGLKYSDNYTTLKNVQRIRIQQVYLNSATSRNGSIIKEESLDIFEGKKKILEFESQQFPDLNPRQLTLYFDGQHVQAGIAHYNEVQGIAGHWSCRTFNESAPKRKSFLFSQSLNKPNPSPPFTDITSSVYEILTFEIIQDDKSCFKENFPDSLKNIKAEVGDCKKKEILVDIKQSIGNVQVVEMRESLIAGQVKYVEVTSYVTDVMNPRYLVMLYDGDNIQAAINKISQQLPTASHCNSVNNSAPYTWYPEFAYNVTSQDSLCVEFLDPMKPWSEEQDLECFDIQFPTCKRRNTTDMNRKARIFVTHYFTKKYQSTTEEVKKFSVEVTEGRVEVVQIESEFQSGNFENRTPRNLSLYLEDSVLHAGMGQLEISSSGESLWSCSGSSAVLETGSEEVKMITFSHVWDTSRQRHFLSFSWNPSSSNGLNNCANIVLIFLLLIYIMLSQHGLN